MTSSLIIQTSFLGDVVLTTPLIAHLARNGPVDVVTIPAAAPLLHGNPAVRRVVAYDKHETDSGPLGMWRVARAVRSTEPDGIAYLAQGSMRSGLVALLAQYRERVGFDTSDGAPTYTRKVRYRADQHHAERLVRLSVGNEAIIERGALMPSLFPSAADRQAVDSLLVRHSAAEGRLIALAPGSIWATKRWPYFPALARALSSHARIVIVGGTDDRPLAGDIVATTPHAIDATGTLSLLQSAELIRRAALLVTNDSLPQHLASAMGTRTVTIFGPTIAGFGFGPLAAGSLAIGHDDMPCRPCHPHGPRVCPLGHHLCMRDVGHAAVLVQVLKTIAA